MYILKPTADRYETITEERFTHQGANYIRPVDGGYRKYTFISRQELGLAGENAFLLMVGVMLMLLGSWLLRHQQSLAIRYAVCN